jgi:hypothetical protein
MERKFEMKNRSLRIIMALLPGLNSLHNKIDWLNTGSGQKLAKHDIRLQTCANV